MPKFLSAYEVYRVIQRELPEGAYPDGPASAFFSTADSYASGQAVATLYDNLARIYANNFPQTADERIDDWVFKVFGFYLPAGTTLGDKRQRVIDKIRKQPTISLWEILKLVAQSVPRGTFVQVAEYQCGAAQGWKLGVSLLGATTYLNFNNTYQQLNLPPGTDWCGFVRNQHWRLGRDALGVNTFLSKYTQEQIYQPQAKAYGYEIRIFDYVLPPEQLMQLDFEVKAAEPARSYHVFRQGLQLVDFGLVRTVNNVDQFSGVTCIAVDDSQTTGFIGKTI